MVQPRRTGGPDVHGGTLPDRLEALEDLDLVRAIVRQVGGRDLRRRRRHGLPLADRGGRHADCLLLSCSCVIVWSTSPAVSSPSLGAAGPRQGPPAANPSPFFRRRRLARPFVACRLRWAPNQPYRESAPFYGPDSYTRIGMITYVYSHPSVDKGDSTAWLTSSLNLRTTVSESTTPRKSRTYWALKQISVRDPS